MAFVVELKQFPQPRNAAGVPGVFRAEVSMLAKESHGGKACESSAMCVRTYGGFCAESGLGCFKLPSGLQGVTLAVYKSISSTSHADMPPPAPAAYSPALLLKTPPIPCLQGPGSTWLPEEAGYSAVLPVHRKPICARGLMPAFTVFPPDLSGREGSQRPAEEAPLMAGASWPLPPPPLSPTVYRELGEMTP